MEEIKSGLQRYHKTNSDKFELKLSFYYDLGGMNYFTGRVEKRGYYLSCSPVERSDGWIKTTAFTGAKVLLNEVKRKSEKQKNIAHTAALNEMNNLLKHVADKNNLVLVRDELFDTSDIKEAA